MAGSGEESRKSRAKREYVPPRLERLGTIRDLTRGEGKNNVVDSSHPPGQNKSRF